MSTDSSAGLGDHTDSTYTPTNISGGTTTKDTTSPTLSSQFANFALSLPSAIPYGTILKPLTVLAAKTFNPSYTDTAIDVVEGTDGMLSLFKNCHAVLSEMAGKKVVTGDCILSVASGMGAVLKGCIRAGGASILSNLTGLDRASSYCMSSLTTDMLAKGVHSWWTAQDDETDLARRLKEINDPSKYGLSGEKRQEWENAHDTFFLHGSECADPIAVTEESIATLCKYHPWLDAIVTEFERQWREMYGAQGTGREDGSGTAKAQSEGSSKAQSFFR